MASSEASINVHDHGKAVDGKKQRVQCNYCGKEMSGFFRLKYHLGGVRGDVIPCEMVSEDVKELFKNMLPERGGRLSQEVRDLSRQDLPWKRNGCPNSNVAKKMRRQSCKSSGSRSGEDEIIDSMSEDDVKEPAILPSARIVSQSAVTGDPEEEPSCKQNKRCIGRFFYETGIDLTLVNSPSFQRMINDTHCPGQTNYKIPSCQELKGWILKDEVKEMQEYVEKIRQSWASSGCSILLDGWIDEKGRNLVSFIVDCPQGPIYLHSSDVSASVDDVDALQLLFDRVIDDVGVENVVQIIAFSTEGWVGAVGKQFMGRSKTVFWTVNASHCIELMLDKIAMMGEIRGTLENARTISKFIHGHLTVLNLLRDYTDGHDLIKPTKVRSAMPFVTLENIIAEKKNLKAMFASSEWNTSAWASRAEGKRVADLVGDPSFWKGAGRVVKTALPLIRVLCLINGDDKPQMGYIYETMDQMKETIKKECNSKESQYMPFWELIDKIWDGHLHSPLHAAGHFLNPSLFYSTDFQSDSEVAFGLLCCMVRMIQSQPIQDKIVQQLEAYRNSEGAFGEGSTVQQRTRFSSTMWWSTYGGRCPELQRFATRILSQTCVGASKYRLNRSLVEKLLTKGRNPVEQQLLSDLIFVHYNLQLQQQQRSQFGVNYDIAGDEIDAMDEWIVDDTPEIGSRDGDSAWKELDGAVNGGRPSSQVKEEYRQV
ncbi:HAT transposon superfamily protein, putative [Theobroma cacao]|uniref:HAT transposon superfamily protein, putative n=1 Tax=Theobroma cacao TaxID=3641 RepID=A0A061GGP8_THECC|nr:HAT transposon superfamily protein, putative [Theobroma cacao]